MAESVIYLPVAPSLRGFSGPIIREASGAGRRASAAIGQEMQSGARTAGQQAGRSLADGLASQRRQIETISAQLASARSREADASGAVRVAEQRLQEVRQRGNATASQIAQGEEALARARRGQESAQSRVTSTSQQLDRVRSGEVTTARAVLRAEEQLDAARTQVANANGRIRIAETQLNELRARGNTSASQLTTAEERLRTAQREQASAVDNVRSRQLLLTNAQSEATQTTQHQVTANDNHTESLERSESRMSSMAGTAAKWGAAIGAASGAAGAALFQVGSQFDDMDDALRVTGAKAGQLDALSASARNVAANVPAMDGGMSQIGETMATLYQRTGLTGGGLETLTSQMLQLQNLGQELSLDDLTGAMTAFGIKGTDTSGALDQLFRVSQSTGVAVSDLATSAIKGGPALRQFGFGLADSAALAGSLDKAGLDADKTLAGMTKSLASFAKAGRDPKKALTETIGSISDLVAKGDQVGAINLAAKLFGTKGAAQFVDAVRSGALSVEGLKAATAGTGDTILGVADDTADFAEQWELFKQKAFLALEPVATRVFGIISTGMGWIADHGIPAIRDLGGYFSQLAGPLQSSAEFVDRNRIAFMTVGGIITALLLPYLTVLGVAYVATGISAASSAAAQVIAWVTTGGAASASGLTSVLMSYRIVGSWIAQGVTATSSAAVVVAGWVATGARAVWGAGVAVFQGGLVVASWIAQGATATAQAIVIGLAWAASVARAGLAVAATLAYAAATGVVAAATGVWTAVQWALNSAFLANPITWIVLLVVGLIAVIVLIATKTTWFQTAWDVVWGAIVATWNAVYGALSAGFHAFINFFTDTIPNAAGSMKDFVVEKFNALVSFVTGLPGRIKTALGNLFGPLKDGFRDAINWIVDAWNNFSLHFDFEIPIINKKVDFTIDTPDLPRFRDGGQIGGRGGPRADDQVIAASTGEFMVNAKSTAANLPLVTAINQAKGPLRGFKDGGLITADEKQKLAGGTVNTSLWEAIKTNVPGAELNNAYRSGDPGYHGIKKALDVVGPMQKVADYLFGVKSQLAQIIWNPGPVWYNVRKNELGTGVATAEGAKARGIYGEGTMAGHADHVHVAAEQPFALPKPAAPPAPSNTSVTSAATATPSTTAPSSSSTTTAPKKPLTVAEASSALGQAVGTEILGDTLDFFGFKKLYDAGVTALTPAETSPSAGEAKAPSVAEAVAKGSEVASNPGAAAKAATPAAPDPTKHVYNPKGGAEQWRPMIVAALKKQGYPVNDAEVNAWVKQIKTESGGDPNIAQQITDVNGTGEAAGVGLGQIIPQTWAANRDPSLPDNRRDPWAAINGMVRYGHKRYGDSLLQNIGQGHGYDSGGWLPPTPKGFGTFHNFTGKPEAVLTAGQWDAVDSMLEALPSAGAFKAVADVRAPALPSLLPAVEGDTPAPRREGPLVHNENVFTFDVEQLAREQGREVRRATRSDQLVGGWT